MKQPYHSNYRSSTLLQKATPKSRAPKVLKLIALAAILAVVAGAVWLGRPQSSGNEQAVQNSNQSNSATNSNTTEFDTSQHSIDDPTSPWVVANKQRPLNPINYAPSDLRAPNVKRKYSQTANESKIRDQAASALESMITAAQTDSVQLMLVSGYRSYSQQEGLFNYYVGLQGRAEAERQSARPGHSEHQTGWAADVGAANGKCQIQTCFGDTPEGIWVAAHAHEHGYIIRYPQGLQGTVGFDYEPWHLRFVGTELAAELHRTNTLTLEDYFGLPPAPEY